MKKDIFSESKRLDAIATKIRDVFMNWGYREIFLPCVTEYSDDLRRGLKITYDNRFYVVRPDITSQIAANYKNGGTTRKYYICEILDGVDGTLQAGVEFLCDDPLKNKVEVLSVMISVLENLGIEDFYIDVGSLRVWRECVEEVREFEDEIFRALKRRNLSLLDDIPIPREKKEDLWDLLNLRGGKSGFKKIDELLEVIGDERIYADLGTMRPLPYYEDIIFEIYSSQVGYPIGGGGEYTVNGVNGCGFALDLALISEIYDGDRDDGATEVRGDLSSSYGAARDLVKQGKKVVIR